MPPDGIHVARARLSGPLESLECVTASVMSSSACFWACSACLVLSCYQRGEGAQGASLGGCQRGPLTSKGIDLHLLGGSSGRHSPSHVSSGIPGIHAHPALVSFPYQLVPRKSRLTHFRHVEYLVVTQRPCCCKPASLGYVPFAAGQGSVLPRQSSDAAPPSLGLPYQVGNRYQCHFSISNNVEPALWGRPACPARLIIRHTSHSMLAACHGRFFLCCSQGKTLPQNNTSCTRSSSLFSV